MLTTSDADAGQWMDAIEELTSSWFAQIDEEGGLWLPPLHQAWVLRFGMGSVSYGDAPTLRRP